MNPISTGSDWSFELLERYEAGIAQCAAEFGLDTYANQIEVITSEQMLDACASTGLPIGYPHWSHGKAFIANERAYRKGWQGLAYEIVINSDPCIAYLMEENSMAMQALVIAHASFGHNSFFKGNYLFRQWTQASGILDYLVFARNYVLECEERHGVGAVEELLDSCHALMDYGVSRYRRAAPLSLAAEKARGAERREQARLQYNELWRTLPAANAAPSARAPQGFPAEPEENILYFVEKHSPKLEPWQREIVRIVRKLAQYFYPQAQTKLMNEGWATFWHYTLINRLYEKGLVTDGFMLEFLQSHTNVVSQHGFDEAGYGGLNPYALGFAMMQDIRRVCERPNEEDRRWLPEIAGGDWLKVLDFAMRNFKDESFIAQYLSPRLIREFHLFAVADHEAKTQLEVDAIHNDEGYARLRRLLAAQYRLDQRLPDIQVARFARDGDRSLLLRHQVQRGRCLIEDQAGEVLKHLARLWGFTVTLQRSDADGRVESVQTCAI